VTEGGAAAEKPLAGKCIVVTRARAQAADLGMRLEALGAAVVYCPAIKIAPPEDPEPFQDAVSRLDAFDWVILTSVNGVIALMAELDRQGLGVAALARLSVACVGPATAQALRRRGVAVDAMPERYVGAEIATVLADRMRADQRRLLLARAASGDAELPRRLREMGAEVTEVESYRSIQDLENIAELQAQLKTGVVDVIVFTAPSTATFLLERAGVIPPSVVLAAIGPVTAARLQELGHSAAIVAPEHTMAGLVRAVSSFLATRDVSRGPQ
jgi:uroporphyrinogen-III synthase